MLLTTKEIALKWGVSVTWVTVLCKKGRIEGAIREGNRWYIPEDAKKPEDKRSCKNAPAKARFRFIDLFAGVGGFHQAMRYLGGECVMAAEVNEECKKTYRLNYHTEEKEIRGDVREIDPTTIAPFDVLCAGFPCQPFSKAGAQRGFQDKTRGNLFYTIMDILDAHPEVKFVILENVRNLADKTENWDIITSELTQRNFYITEEPIILSPSDFGIPQIRERVYILGIRKDIRNEKILSNGFIHKTDLQLEKHFKKCKMGDAWTILEDNVDDTYIISQEQEQMIYAWDEFRIGTGLKVIGFPVWIDSFGVGIDDDNEVFHSQGYDDMPSWKQNFLRHNRKLYLDNRAFIDDWVKKYDISIYDLFGYAGEAVGLATVIMAAYERWLWRINPFETTPALKKIYTGKIVSSYDNIERPIELYIKQSLLPVQITMVSAESRSNSLSASVTGINGENSLIYHYLNTPQSKYRDRSEVHYGTAVLTIIDGTMLKGRYYTDRKTNGDIELIVKE